MKTKLSFAFILSVAFFSVVFIACNKDNASTISSDTSSEDDIAVAATDTTKGGGSSDSVHLVHDCRNGLERDSISQADLPAAADEYLQSTYPDYTFDKAFSVSDSTGAVTGYIAVVYFEDKPVGVEFDSEGNFVRVLEQRAGRHGEERDHR